jgi:hypothetical protein
MLKELKNRYHSGATIDFRIAAYTTLFYAVLFFSTAFGFNYPTPLWILIWWAAGSFVILFTIIFQNIDPNIWTITICLPWFSTYIVYILWLKIVNLKYYPHRRWSKKIIKQNNYRDFFNNTKYEDLL